MASSSDDKLRAFLLARDKFFGDNYVSADCETALRELATMDHEEAVWLSGLFRDKAVPGRITARAVFLEHPEDKRALFMSGMLGLIVSGTLRSSSFLSLLNFFFLFLFSARGL